MVIFLSLSGATYSAPKKQIMIKGGLLPEQYASFSVCQQNIDQYLKHIFNQKQIKSELWQLELNRIAKDNYRHHKYCISSFLTLSIRLSEIPKSIFL